MALNKNFINENGVATTYHKFSSVHMEHNVLKCVLDSYVSKEYRDLEQCAESNIYFFDFSVEEEESMGIRALCYTKLKQLPNWSDATDC